MHVGLKQVGGFFAALALAVDPSLGQGLLGPGISNLAWKQTDLFKPLYTFHSVSAAGAAPKGLNHVAMVNGYLFLPYGEDSGAPGGGISFWDVSDPRAPKLVYSQDENDLREAHGYGFHQYN